MLRKNSRLHLERLEAREVPAAISSLAAPPVLAVTVAPIVPVAPTTVTNSNSVVIGISLADPTFMSPGSAPRSPATVETGTPYVPLVPYQFYPIDPTYYGWMAVPLA